MTTTLQHTSLGELGYSPLGATSLGELGAFLPNLGEARTQDFLADNRVLLSEETNRDLTIEDKNAKILFSEQGRTASTMVTGRKLSTGSKRKVSGFKGKNRTLH